ncbi:MAG: hypothetical protein WAJ92_14985 [Candidatus Acidiferrales bacterium]
MLHSRSTAAVDTAAVAAGDSMVVAVVDSTAVVAADIMAAAVLMGAVDALIARLAEIQAALVATLPGALPITAIAAPMATAQIPIAEALTPTVPMRIAEAHTALDAPAQRIPRTPVSEEILPTPHAEASPIFQLAITPTHLPAGTPSARPRTQPLAVCAAALSPVPIPPVRTPPARSARPLPA